MAALLINLPSTFVWPLRFLFDIPNGQTLMHPCQVNPPSVNHSKAQGFIVPAQVHQSNKSQYIAPLRLTILSSTGILTKDTAVNGNKYSLPWSDHKSTIKQLNMLIKYDQSLHTPDQHQRHKNWNYYGLLFNLAQTTCTHHTAIHWKPWFCLPINVDVNQSWKT